jgi:hypothetical protein
MVLIDQHTAPWVLWLLEQGLANTRRNCVPLPADVAEVIAELRQVATARRAEAIGRCGGSADDGPVILTSMTSDQAAKALGCTPRNVVDLVGRSTLRARKSGRSWQIDPLSVRELLDERAEVGS